MLSWARYMYVSAINGTHHSSKAASSPKSILEACQSVVGWPYNQLPFQTEQGLDYHCGDGVQSALVHPKSISYSSV